MNTTLRELTAHAQRGLREDFIVAGQLLEMALRTSPPPAEVVFGPGSRAFQDDRARAGQRIPVGRLLIDAPGRDSVDFFGQRIDSGLCPACAGLALVSSQMFGQAMGAGYRAGILSGRTIYLPPQPPPLPGLTVGQLYPEANSIWLDDPGEIGECGICNATDNLVTHTSIIGGARREDIRSAFLYHPHPCCAVLPSGKTLPGSASFDTAWIHMLRHPPISLADADNGATVQIYRLHSRNSNLIDARLNSASFYRSAPTTALNLYETALWIVSKSVQIALYGYPGPGDKFFRHVPRDGADNPLKFHKQFDTSTLIGEITMNVSSRLRDAFNDVISGRVNEIVFYRNVRSTCRDIFDHYARGRPIHMHPDLYVLGRRMLFILLAQSLRQSMTHAPRMSPSSKIQTLSVTEASAILHVSPIRVRQLIKSGKLRAQKNGRDWVIETASVESMPQSAGSGGRRGRPRKNPT